MLRVTILKKSTYYHDKVAERHYRKVEGACKYCGAIFVSTFFGTADGAKSAHICDDCRIDRQKMWNP